jgi:hypothetical protein
LQTSTAIEISTMTKFPTIKTLFLLLGSASIASARLSLLRMNMTPVHAKKHIIQNSEFGPSHHREDGYGALRELAGYLEDLSMSMVTSMSMPDFTSPLAIGIEMTGVVLVASSGDISAPSPSPTTPSKDGLTDTTAPPSEPKSSSDTSGPTSSPVEVTSAPKLEPDTDVKAKDEGEVEADGDGVISDILGSNTSSSSGRTPGQTAMIVLVVVVVSAVLAMLVGLVFVGRKNILASWLSSSSSSSSISASISSGSDGPSQVDGSLPR